ncbi:FAD/NAD(P)-binding domain-containing protein [Stipitochalara longipes BDJ]|nr:FAD/NAD(P)-binding domain-containing protein [Stipitochalara longipes BDJ]
MDPKPRTESEKLNVAIIGAGIAGLTLAIALANHPLINTTIYEKATELREIGASIALGPNGLRTLERLGLSDVISDENGFRGTGTAGMVYRHWKTNEVIGKDEHADVKEWLHQTTRFHRGHLHGKLVEHVPRESIKLGKKVAGIDIEEGGVAITFEDGSRALADIAVGADGLRSGTRQALVPGFKLKWSGSVAFRSVFDASLVETIPDIPEDSAHWWGPQGNFFSSRLGRNMYTVVGGISVNPDDPDAEFKDVSWDDDGDVQLLREEYKNWNPVVKSLTEVTPSIRYHPNFSCSGPLDTWVFGNRVTLIGDAAHAHGGAYATGGSLAIDDAYALYLSLISVFPILSREKPTLQEIGTALRLYEATRKPHAEKLLKIVHAGNAAKLEKTRNGRIETDEQLRERATRGSNTAWLHEHDVVKTFEETIRASREGVGNEAEVFARL